MAMGAIRALEAVGRRVPAQASVTGFDDISRRYGFRPVLTSIAFDRYKMGRRAVEILRDSIETPATHAASQEAFPVELTKGNSTQPIGDSPT